MEEGEEGAVSLVLLILSSIRTQYFRESLAQRLVNSQPNVTFTRCLSLIPSSTRI